MPPALTATDATQSNGGVVPNLLERIPTPVHTTVSDNSVSGGLVYTASGGASAWWTPIQAPNDGQFPAKASLMGRHSKRNGGQSTKISRRSNNDAPVEMVAMSSRPRLRKVDEKGQLVWPFELEAVLIAGTIPFHDSSFPDRYHHYEERVH